MTGETSNGQGASRESPGPKAPDASEVMDHLKGAAEEVVSAGRALLDMLEQAVGGFLSAMSTWGQPREKADKPRVERIDVEDDRKPKDD